MQVGSSLVTLAWERKIGSGILSAACSPFPRPAVAALVANLKRDFRPIHPDIDEVFLEHYEAVKHHISIDGPVTDRQVAKPVQPPIRQRNLFGMRSKGTAAELEARRRLAVRRVGRGLDAEGRGRLPGRPPGHRRQVGGPAHGPAGTTAWPPSRTPGRPPFLTPDQEARSSGGWPTRRPSTGSGPTCGRPAGWPS